MIKTILLEHAKRYPLMEPTDAVKLIYQNEFGVGHLISDTTLFQERLRQEAASVTVIPEMPLIEDIGNGLVRVMLNAMESPKLNLDQLTEACIQTAQNHQGTLQSFIDKIGELKTLCESGVFAFTPHALDSYLESYRKQDCPPVSHSATYREAYHPAYRVVLGNLILDN